MGDMGDIFNDLRKFKQEKRADNTKKSTYILTTMGIPYTSHNGGSHLQVIAGKQFIDFWPATGLWIIRGSKKQYRGVKNLISYYNEVTSNITV